MKKKIILVVVGLFLYILYNNFIYTDSIEKALKKEEGTTFRTIPMIDDEHALVFSEKDARSVHAIALSKRKFGWKLVDEIKLPVNPDVSGFNKMETSLEFDLGKKKQLIMAVIMDQAISDLDIYAKHHTELSVNKTNSDNGTVLYYWFGDETLSELTYKAYSNKGKLLYVQ